MKGTLSRVRHRPSGALRIETTAEIKTVAMDLMAKGGPAAVALRAIARRMGITPNAIYGHFATRDDLVTTLIGDVSAGLADATDNAMDPAPPNNPAAQIRAWALAHPRASASSTAKPCPAACLPKPAPKPKRVSVWAWPASPS